MGKRCHEKKPLRERQGSSSRLPGHHLRKGPQPSPGREAGKAAPVARNRSRPAWECLWIINYRTEPFATSGRSFLSRIFRYPAQPS